MAQRRLTIMIVPHSHKRIREITVSQRALWVAGAAITVVTILSLGYAIGFHIRSGQAQELEYLRKENSELTGRIREVSTSINSLKGEINDLSHTEEMLRVLANLPQVDPEVQMAGVGGMYSDEEDAASTLSYAARLGMNLHSSVDQLLRQAEFQKRDFEIIEQSFRDSIDLREHLPSIWPVAPSQVYISSTFGPRPDPFTGRARIHNGLDLAGRPGTPVMATASGVVKAATKQGYIGNVVQIDHLHGYSTIYGHLNRIYVHVGQHVERGQAIGEIGNTGRSTGPHLHYSVFYRNRSMDPQNFLFARSDAGE